MAAGEYMLTIKRVPTVVSNYQEETSRKTDGGCGRNCLRDCCLPGSTLPLYAFKKEGQENSEEGDDTNPCNEEQQAQTCFLHNLLLSQWEDRMSRGLFRYDVTCCETKIIQGKLGFIAQLNEGRHLKKRPTEFRIDKVLQDFDDSKFNFTKVGQEEILFRFEENTDKTSRFFPSTSVHDDVKSGVNVVAINVSPIEYGHVLLIPRVLDRLPQRIDHESFFLAMKFSKEAADPFFRIGYNSLGAFATINHLHFQAYYMAVPFPVEKAPTRRINTNTNTKPGWSNRRISVSCLLSYPVRGYVFKGGCSLKDLSDAVASACVWLQDNNIPFNVLISDSAKRVFLFPQCYAEKQALGQVRQELAETQVNPAIWEISGHIVLKKRQDYENASEKSAWRLLAEVSLSEEKFNEIKVRVLDAVGLQEEEQSSSKQKIDRSLLRQFSSNSVDHQHLAEDCLVFL